MSQFTKILAIETSCDETAIAVVEGRFENGNPICHVINSVVRSQIDLHTKYGGVLPSLAKREHATCIVALIGELLEELFHSPLREPKITSDQNHQLAPDKIERARQILEREPETFSNLIEVLPKIGRPNIDVIAVTTGPGLEPALWVGINTARALSVLWDIPVIGINHMEGHIASVLINSENKTEFPAVSLLISGGHTELIEMKDWGQYNILGATKDDAVGEAFDKVARLLGLTYPGGPNISKYAKIAEQKRATEHTIKVNRLPRPMISSGDLDFSFSGLKTAVLYSVRDFRERNKMENDRKLPEAYVAGMAKEFQDSVIEVLISKTKKAIEEVGAKTLIIGGGVIANSALRESFQELVNRMGSVTLSIPELSLTTDNASMIGCAAILALKRREPAIDAPLIADGSWRVSGA